MQIINIVGAVALLSTSVVAAPQNLSPEGMDKRWWWSGNQHNKGPHGPDPTATSKPWGMTGKVNMTPSGTGISRDPTATPWYPTSSAVGYNATSSAPSSTSSCTTPPVSTAYTTICITVTTYKSPFTMNSTTSFTGTGYSTGVPSASDTSSAIYVNSTSTVASYDSTSMTAAINTTTTSMQLSTGYPSASITSSVNATKSHHQSTKSHHRSTRTTTVKVWATSRADPVNGTSTTGITSSSSSLATSTSTTWDSNDTTLITATSSGFTTSTTVPCLPFSDFIPATSVTSKLGSTKTRTRKHRAHPTSTLTATTTISGTACPTGSAIPTKALLCDVHGLPVGDYFLGEFVESKTDVAITLYTCYQFCAGVYGINMGCLSFDFYPEPGTGAARCDLYGGTVAQSIDSIIPSVPNQWYDLGCVVPMK